jgi:hypothetical protein
MAAMKANEMENMEELAKQFGINDLKLEDLKVRPFFYCAADAFWHFLLQNPQSTLMKLIRGERRHIQDELANRVLSDISEESSLIDSSTTQNSDRSTTRQQQASGEGGEEKAGKEGWIQHGLPN